MLLLWVRMLVLRVVGLPQGARQAAALAALLQAQQAAVVSLRVRQAEMRAALLVAARRRVARPAGH